MGDLSSESLSYASLNRISWDTLASVHGSAACQRVQTAHHRRRGGSFRWIRPRWRKRGRFPSRWCLTACKLDLTTSLPLLHHLLLRSTTDCTQLRQPHRTRIQGCYSDSPVTTVYSSQYIAISSTMTTSIVPSWVADLNNPPQAKSKNAGIPDPPGFPSQAVGNKVCVISSRWQPSTRRVAGCPGSDWLTDAVETSKQDSCPNAANPRGNRPAQTQEGLGSRFGTCETASHDRDHDVHVGQLFANL